MTHYEQLADKDCLECDGKGIVPDYVYDLDAKSSMMEGVRACICVISKKFEMAANNREHGE